MEANEQLTSAKQLLEPHRRKTIELKPPTKSSVVIKKHTDHPSTFIGLRFY